MNGAWFSGFVTAYKRIAFCASFTGFGRECLLSPLPRALARKDNYLHSKGTNIMRLRPVHVFSVGVLLLSMPEATEAQEPVRVVNTPLPVSVPNPLPVVVTSVPVPTRRSDLPAFQPVQRAATIPVPFSGVASPPQAIYTVPQGKRLVIEYVEGRVGWRTTAGGTTVHYDPGVGEGRVVRIYADPGTQVFVHMIPPGHPSGVSARFSGHLVDL